MFFFVVFFVIFTKICLARYDANKYIEIEIEMISHGKPRKCVPANRGINVHNL